MLFTLTLPVTRRRLLLTRAGLGWLLLAGTIAMMYCGMWMLFPVLRANTSAAQVLENIGVLVACASGLYAIPVLLSTFLNELWRTWGTMIALVALLILVTKTPLPASVNIFLAMSDSSPLIAHTVPWTAMELSLGLAAILFFAALRIVRARQF